MRWPLLLSLGALCLAVGLVVGRSALLRAPVAWLDESVVGSEEQAAEEDSPLIFTLEVNGLSYPIKPGKLLTLPADGSRGT